MDEDQIKQWLTKNLVIEFTPVNWGEYPKIGLRFHGDERCFTEVNLPFEDSDD